MKNWLKFIPAYLYKTLLGKPIYLQALMPVIGALHVVKNPKLTKTLYPLIACYSIGIVAFFLNPSFSILARTTQWVLMVLFCQFLISNYSKSEFIKLFKIILYVTFVHYIFEFLIKYFLHIHIMEKSLFHGFGNSFKIFVLSGPIGEQNFTAIMLAGIALFFLAEKIYLFALFALLLIIPTVSRTAILICVGSIPFNFISLRFSRIKKFLTYSLSLFFILSPLLLFTAEKTLSDEIKNKINNFTNGRYLIQSTYLEMVKKYPLGTGPMQGPKHYHQFINTGSSIINNSEIRNKSENNVFGYLKTINVFNFNEFQQHSITIQILSELGFLGYFFFSFFIFFLVKKSLEINIQHCLNFSILLIGFLFLNGTAEFIFYAYTAFLISQSKTKEIL